MPERQRLKTVLSESLKSTKPTMQEPKEIARVGPAQARPCEPPGATAPEVVGLSAQGRFDDSASGGLEGLGEEASCSN